MKLKLEVNRLEKFPPWFYGYSYSPDYEHVRVFHIIPLNLIVRLGMTIAHFWNRWRSKPTWIDRAVKRHVSAIIAANQNQYMVEQITNEVVERIIPILQYELSRLQVNLELATFQHAKETPQGPQG